MMVYTNTSMTKGEFISKEVVRVGTWLRTVSGISYISLFRAQSMTSTGTTAQVASFSELHIPINQLVGYHILPPAQEPLDYDPTEPHRKMESLILTFGPFRALCKLRIGETSSLSIHLKTSREAYMSIYEVEVSNPSLPNMAAIKAPMMLVQPSLVTFAIKA
jgi:hypothetical protein